MREKEEREGVKQRKGGFVNIIDQISTSFFFTNFPEDLGWGDLWKLFAKFGNVGDVFIPKKVDKWGRKFGFVKFKEVKEVEVMSEKLEDVWWDSYKLRINRARFGKGDKKEGDTSNRNQTQRLLVGNDLQVSDEMSYKTLLLEKDDMVERKLTKMVCW
jgi:RNA recognition motif-containing protein